MPESKPTRTITDKFPGDVNLEVGASYGAEGTTIHARDVNSGVTFSVELWQGGRFATPNDIWEALTAVFQAHHEEEEPNFSHYSVMLDDVQPVVNVDWPAREAVTTYPDGEIVRSPLHPDFIAWMNGPTVG